MVHFTPLQVILNIVIALLAVALPTWVLWIVGSKIPPALTCEGRKSGFAGSLPFFTATLVFFFLYWVIMTAVDAAQAYRFILMSVDYTPLQILLPRGGRSGGRYLGARSDRDTGVVFLLPDPGPQCDGALRLILLRARRNGLPRVLRPCGADLRNPKRPLTQAAQGFR